MKFLNRGILVFIFFLMFFTPVFAQEEKNVIRVGISNQSFSTFEHKSAKFVSVDGMSIVDMVSSAKADIKPNEVVSVEFSKGNFKIYTDKVRKKSSSVSISEGGFYMLYSKH